MNQFHTAYEKSTYWGENEEQWDQYMLAQIAAGPPERTLRMLKEMHKAGYNAGARYVQQGMIELFDLRHLIGPL